MPVVERQPDKANMIRFSANLSKETKARLEDYAYKKRITLAKALEILICDGVERDSA